MADPLSRPPVVLDCGTGFVKAGLAGEPDPSLVCPSVVGYPALSAAAAKGGRKVASDPLADLDYVCGDEALRNPAYAVSYPMKHGLVVDWESAEKLWTAAIYKHLRVAPQGQPFILTEPPLNPPENREQLAEVFFETFGVPGLHIGIQAVLALYASFAAASRSRDRTEGSLTGVVVDSGAGCTHCIPVSEGFVLGSSIESIPVAGRDVTAYVQQFCYVCGDPQKEALKYEQQRDKYWRSYSGVCVGQPWAAAVGLERFLGPEIFFTPSLQGAAGQHRASLPALIDSVVQSCPIDTRRALYSNIVLSGGSTLFRDFGRRIQRDVKQTVDARTQGAANEVEVRVLSHPMQRYAVWFGGSLLGVSPGFRSLLVSKAEYEEHGPSIVRGNAVYREC
eukprot:scaffold20.g7834.t1